MNRLRLLGYGARLAVAGGRATRVRIALMAGGIAIGVAMLLALFSVLPAVSALVPGDLKRKQNAWRTGALSPEREQILFLRRRPPPG